MTMFVLSLVLLSLVVLALTAELARLVAHDGLGVNPLPRSHFEETGTWVDQQLRR